MCPGYTGSPVSCEENGNPVLVGLQSFNWVCNTANTPGIYTSIRSMRDWIDYILDKNQ
jgi:secreted trypsin-like serine protease